MRSELATLSKSIICQQNSQRSHQLATSSYPSDYQTNQTTKMCGRHRAAGRAARRGCGPCGRRYTAPGPAVVYEPRQSLVRQIVNHFIESRQQKQALARGQYVQPRALEQGKQEMGVDMGRGEWVDEKQNLRIEDLGTGVDRVARNSVELPSYREALKN